MILTRSEEIYTEIPRGDDGYVRMLEDLEEEEAQALGLMDENGEYIYPVEPGSMVLINEQIDGSDDPIGDEDGDGFNDEKPYAIYKGRDNQERYEYENNRSTQTQSNDAYDFQILQHREVQTQELVQKEITIEQIILIIATDKVQFLLVQITVGGSL